MISDWKECFWGDIATLEYGKSLRDYRDKKGPYPVYGTNGLIGSHTEPLCTNPGVIIGRKGAYRGVHYSPNPFYVIDTAFYLKPKIKDLDLLFAYYELLTHDINSMDSGSAIPSTSREDFYNLPLRLPPIEEQLAISKLLNKFDEKIELNQDMNRTLEAIGQAIFRHWFVHFEFPDGEGRPYKSSGGDMVDSELGEIPKGWEIGKLKGLGNIVCGKTPPKSKQEYFEGQVPFIKIPDMHNQTFVGKTEDSLTKEGKKFQQNKTLPANSVCVSCIATVGLVCITSKESQTNQQINSIIPKYEFLTPYLYHKMNSMKDLIEILASGGSATLNLNTKNFSNIEIIIPDNDILKNYYVIVKPLFDHILTNQIQNENLSQIRDSLLPKLMSGKIRVNIPKEVTAK